MMGPKDCDVPNKTADALDQREEMLLDVLRWFAHCKEATTSLTVADAFHWSHEEAVGVLNSLSSRGKLYLSAPEERVYWILTDEGRRYAAEGTPEARLVQLVQSRALDITVADLSDTALVSDQEIASIGLKNAMKLKWVELEKGTKRLRVVLDGPVVDTSQQWLMMIDEASKAKLDQAALVQKLQDSNRLDAQSVERMILQELKKRKLAVSKKVKFYNVTRGPQFSLELKTLATDLTQDMVLKETWKTMEFKPYNFHAAGTKPSRGSIHPLIHSLHQFTKILLSMGFEEMPTEHWVESSFWNFDALFQPQQHPARDAQDTFFLEDPASVPFSHFPLDYAERVRSVHEKGGYGSVGWRYTWSQEETAKNVLRTHTTACSARMLYALGKEYQQTGIFVPKRYFSIDRVFRNETLDATHLAEFHQVEGLICDRSMTLAHLMGVLKTFYAKIGIVDLRFKPTFNPYTEPSMEIFGFHTSLKKWIEVGNSGMFRPEMLLPMGLPEDVTVIAWGLSLERPTMIRYGVNNIRELFGHKAVLGIV